MNKYKLKEIKIEVTQNCPLNCIHCSSEANISKTQELSELQVIKTIEEAKNLGVEEVTISGGEPLMWEPLSRVINYFNRTDLPITVYTTGVPFSTDNNLLKSMLRAGLKSVVVSLHGATSEIHEYITRDHGSFDKTISSIKRMISNGITVGIHFVAMTPNWKELPKIAELAKGLGVSKVSVLRFVPHGRGSIIKDFFSLTKGEILSLRKEILALKSNKDMVTLRIGSPYNILLLNDNVYCLAAKDRAIIGPDGKVFPCDAFKNVEYKGNFNSLDQGNFIDIWYNSDYFSFIRNELEKGLGATCSSCNSKERCKSGCLAQKVLRISNGGSLHPDPDCILQR